MLRSLVKPNIIRRFTHTPSKPVLPKSNNKIIVDILREHNKHLDRIGDGLGYICITLL